MKKRNRMRSVAIVSPGPFSVPPIVGSSVEHDIDMVSRQLQRDYKVIIYTRRSKKYPSSSQSGRIHYRRFRYRGGKRYVQQVIKDMKKNKPDIIHIENRPAYVMAFRHAFPHIPIVLGMHSKQYASKRYISKRKLKKVAQSVDALITNSESLRQEYEELCPHFKGKAVAVHLGIDCQPFGKASGSKMRKTFKQLSKKYGIRPTDRVLLFAGRIKREKGIHHLLDAFPTVLQAVPQAKILLVGSTHYGRNEKTRYQRKMKRKMHRFRDRVAVTGFVRPHNMPSLYQLAEVVVTPSEWAEPFCRVNLEAMAAGKPIVTTKRGGIPEVVQHRENGYVLSLTQLKQKLPESIIRLLRDHDLRNKMGGKGRERAKTFRWQHTATKYARVYESL